MAVEVASDTGDLCHRNLHFISNDQAKKFLKRGGIDYAAEIRLCVNGRSEPFTVERAVALISEHYPDPA